MAPTASPPPAAAPDGGERRSRLRQYQVQLLERMQAAKSGAVDRSKQLGVQIGARRCLLELTQVGEIVAPAPIGAVPLARDWYLGLSNVRGNLTGIVDLARYRGEPGCQPGAEARVITFAPALGFNCALLVERVLGLREGGKMRDEEEAGGLAAPAWSPRSLVDADGLRWSAVDLALLVREARFLHVGL